MKTFKALAVLLDYPGAELIAALPEMRAVLSCERLLGRQALADLERLIEDLASRDLLVVQEGYVDLFDRGRATSLHLFEHVHGESRDRGQAMIDLQAQYAKRGLRLASHELPDFLPVVLEYLSMGTGEEARELLADCAHILQAIGATLAARNSLYSAVFAALLDFAGEDGFATADAAPAEDLDAQWAEAPVIFGPASAPGAATPLHYAPAAGTGPVIESLQRRR